MNGSLEPIAFIIDSELQNDVFGSGLDFLFDD
jgi:hypothetical protein